MKEVFISYSTVDAENAETVRNVLEKNGLSCWMAPRDIPGGSNYTKEIPIAIRNCTVFVLILSKNAQSSHWVLKELDSAVNCGKVILPFMLEDCLLNDEFNFLLTGAQRYEAYRKKAEAMETLVSRVRGILGVNAPNVTVDVSTEPEPSVKTPSTKKIVSDEVICPACEGSDVKRLPRRVNRHGALELSTMLFIPILAVILASVFFIISSFLVPYEMFGLMSVFILAGAVIGGLWGDYISKTIVRRRRIRRHLPNCCYSCKSCGKVFLSEK